MNEAIYNLLILGGYVALGHLVYSGCDWLWWRYVDWYLSTSNPTIRLDTEAFARTSASGNSAMPLDLASVADS